MAILSEQWPAVRMVAGATALYLGLSARMSLLMEALGGRGRLWKGDGASAGMRGPCCQSGVIMGTGPGCRKAKNMGSGGASHRGG